MNKKLLFLPIEIKTREFYPKLYLATKALDQNYSCFIGDKAGIFRATKYFNNGVYFYGNLNILRVVNHVYIINPMILIF